MLCGQRGYLLARGELDLPLQVSVDRGVDPLRGGLPRRVPEFARPERAVSRAEALDEVGGAEASLAQTRGEGLSLRALGLGGRDPARLAHALQDAVASPHDAVGVPVDRVYRRPSRDGRQRRGLGEREIARGLVEPEAARRVDAAHPGAERGAVDVLLEDVALAQRRLDAQREGRLVDLAQQGSRVRSHEPGELHRERRRPRDDAHVPGVREHGSHHGYGIDPGVLEEALILGLNLVRHL